MITEIDGEPITAQNVAQFINEGKISNLTQIMWVDMIKYIPKGLAATYSYSYDLTVFQGIIDNLSDNRVKVRTVEAMELNCKMYGGNLFRYKDQMQNLLTFFGVLKQSIENYDLFSIEAVKRINPIKQKPDTLETILNRAVKACFVEYSGGKYKRKKPLTWLAVFADILNERGFVKDKFGEIETMFGEKNLAESEYFFILIATNG